MALTDENNMVMPVAPMYGNGGGFGGFGGDWASWIILFLIFGMFGGGWGNGFGGGFGGGELYPWMNQSNQISGGFRDQMLNDSINNIAASQNAMSQQMYSNQIAELERSFAAQTAQTAGMNALQAQLAQCLKKISDKVRDFFCFAKFETVGTLAA